MSITTAMVRVTPITPAVGGVVENIDMSKRLDAEAVQQLREAWLDRGVLFFRNQDITEDQLEAFVAYFGKPIMEPSSGSYGAVDPAGKPVRTGDTGRTKGVAERWLADATWLAEPPEATALRMVKIPPVGGDTLWSNVIVAYEDLIEPLRNLLDKLTALHWMMPSLTALRVKAQDDKTQYVHPVVRVHPETGRKAIYVSEGWTQSIMDIPPAQSTHLLAMLYDHIRSPQYSMRWRWTPGDVAIWDNRAVQHFAVPDYDGGRFIQRLVTAGDRPVGPA
jgi:alpha-ketoglutarate-dependent taurine dioxygenase